MNNMNNMNNIKNKYHYQSRPEFYYSKKHKDWIEIRKTKQKRIEQENKLLQLLKNTGCLDEECNNSDGT